MTDRIKDLLDRAVKTAAQAMLLAIGAEQLNVLEGDWYSIIGFGIGGAILSLLTNLGEDGLRGRLE